MDPSSLLSGPPSFETSSSAFSRAEANQTISFSAPFVTGGGAADQVGQAVAQISPLIVVGALAWIAITLIRR